MTLVGDGPGALDQVKPDENLSDFDRKVFASLAKSLWLPNEFKEYMVQYLSLNQPPIPISQIFGFANFTATTSLVATEESTTSASFVDLATVGPTLTGLPPGQYVMLWGAAILNSTNRGIMGVSVNGASASALEAATAGGSAAYNSATTFKTVSLTEESNTLEAKYRVSASGTAFFLSRSLLALKFANL